MTERLCVVCQQLRQGDPRIYDRPNVCEGHRAGLRAMVAEIVECYALLDDELMPGQSNGQRVSGSREAPLPLRVDPLDLTMPARAATVHDRLGDQIGHQSVASILDAWVRDWRDVLRLNEGLPPPTVATLATWLTNRLEDACDRHPAIDEFAIEMRNLLRTLRRTVGVTEVKPEHLDVPCRRCDLLDLHRLPGEDRVECGSCGDLLTEEEFARWVKLLAAGMVEAS